MLIAVLGISFISKIFIAYLNPEIFFFGEKLGGDKARIYLLANALVGIFLVALLLKKDYWKGTVLAILYFGYNACEGYISYQTVTPFTLLSLLLPILTLILLKLDI
ncbi:hypothetical protein [Ferroglobus placidus]|uniref:hypothetical protein n=1 Tax=Ferroglobus placidus TaxID=54261 RepID=UPI00064F560D|nr:hypothetical protein [Ferroglobus placidus]